MYCCTVVQYRYSAECVLLGALISHAPCFQVVKATVVKTCIRTFWECEESWAAGDVSANQLSYLTAIDNDIPEFRTPLFFQQKMLIFIL